MKKIVLAGGCFWGVEAYFNQLKGVNDTTVGYVDGNKRNPTYAEVCHGVATHAEAIEIEYNPSMITLDKVLEHFFRIINPYAENQQGHDVGPQYRTGIYYYDKSDVPLIEAYLKTRFKSRLSEVKTVVKECLDYDLAESFHQDYLKKNPGGYCHVNLNLASPEEKK